MGTRAVNVVAEGIERGAITIYDNLSIGGREFVAVPLALGRATLVVGVALGERGWRGDVPQFASRSRRARRDRLDRDADERRSGPCSSGGARRRSFSASAP
jgi:hypothetical protein